MTATIIELDPLADAVGPTAEDHHLGPVRGRRLILGPVGRVEVGRVGLELGGTGIHAAKDRPGALGLSTLPNSQLSSQLSCGRLVTVSLSRRTTRRSDHTTTLIQ